MSRRSSWWIAVLLSVLVHAALFLALSRVRSAAPARPSATELEIVYLEPKAPVAAPPVPAPTPRPPKPEPVPPPRRTEEKPPEAIARAPEGKQKEEEPPAVAEAPGVASTEQGPEASPEDAPTRTAPPTISLVPKGLWGSEPPGKPAQSGRTLRNDGQPGEDPRAIARREEAQAKELVDGWAADASAAARAESGAVNPYFTKLQDRFAKKLVNPPSPDLNVLGSRLKREQVEATERFGKTGSPYVAEKRDRRLEQRNRLQAAVEAGRAANMFMMDVTTPVLALATVLEVRQARDGKLLDLKVLEGSGDPKFDAWAVSHLRDALASADAPPESGPGLRADELRSRWRLEEYLGNPRVKVVLIGVY
ncbi:ferrichrome ABC transporter substrate-binding protein [Myxococcus sp. CA051A]|uniref:ferrichrome ABC transporter substrate-binding protein n=1 Tax=Myxococcus sp. CA051A TaxID=2741739 RepID=UPI00157B0198|nr:ferrichrome ABC transporter substrate-binding protein [Myxococcus sp. CA051A]